MKRMWAILAVSAVSSVTALVGCNSDGSWKGASKDTMNDGSYRSASAYSGSSTNSNMNDSNDKRNAGARNNASLDYNGQASNQSGQSNLSNDQGSRLSTSSSVSSSTNSLPAGNLSSGTSAVQTDQNDIQLNHGNDKTTAGVALTNEDRQFVKEAAGGGMYEVQAGEKALAKSTDAHVKEVAQRMVDDHTKANDQLKALAQRKGIEITLLPYGDQIQMLSKLDGLNGTDFDNEYISQQRKAHEDTIAKFQTAASNSSDRDIRDWAATTLPTLREHLRMINNEASPAFGMDR